MAEKRMFSKKIIDTDWFMDMPASSQNLYFHLSMRADDDGFVASPKRIIKLIGATEDDYKILIGKKFIIPFDSGVCVITDWRINNYLRNDRYAETVYKEEKEQLTLNENGKYILGIPAVDPVISNSISNYISNIEKDILDYWNSKKIIQHEKIDNHLKAIQKALKENSLEEIKTYIDRYSKVIKDTNWYFNTKWTLTEFLSQKNAMNDFKDNGSKWVNYQNRQKNDIKTAQNFSNYRDYSENKLNGIFDSLTDIKL